LTDQSSNGIHVYGISVSTDGMDNSRIFIESARLDERARRRLPGGVNSNVRLVAPRRFFARAEGAYLWDVDGNDYVDYLLGQGPAFLGHAESRVNDAVAAASRLGMVFGAQHPLEVEAAELFCETVGWPEMVRFAVSGTEAVQAALRLARATTGRNVVVHFDGQYHGWLDNVLVSANGDFRAAAKTLGQDPNAFSNVLVLPWNDVAALCDTFATRGEEIACVVAEPMMCNSGAILPDEGFLEKLREVCDRSGAILIFDEVISGFRLAAGGAAETFGVRPDLATYGKALAGGWPVAAIAGRSDLMDRFGDGDVVHAGTFNGSTMACAAVIATLQLLRDDPPYERISVHGAALIAGMLELAETHGIPLHVQGLPCAFHASLADHPAAIRTLDDLLATDQAAYARLAATLADHGVWVAGRGIWYVSAAHGPSELDVALARIDTAFEAVTSADARKTDLACDVARSRPGLQ
jgi:glutamate-1-semialdehyde 2,1-aminomutase